MCQRKARDSNPDPRQRGAALAPRSGQPYPATFLRQWTHRESNSDFRHARAVSSRWTMSPCCSEVRLGVEPSLPPYQSGVLPAAPTDLRVIPDGIEPSLSWMSARRLHRWTTGSIFEVTGEGVEPTTSRGSPSPYRHGSSLCLFAYPAMFKLQILESNQASNLMRVG